MCACVFHTAVINDVDVCLYVRVCICMCVDVCISGYVSVGVIESQDMGVRVWVRVSL